MSNKHNLTEYQFARDVTVTFPFLIKELAKFAKVLYAYRRFACVAHVLSAIEDSLEMAKRQQKYYEGVYKNKGKETE